MSRIAEAWKSLSDDEKVKYQDIASKDKARCVLAGSADYARCSGVAPT
jgi:hypothetical protein